MKEKIEQLEHRVGRLYAREREIVREIIAMGDTKEGHVPEKVQALEQERRQCASQRRTFQQALAGLLGQLSALERTASGQGHNVQASIGAALKLLDEEEAK